MNNAFFTGRKKIDEFSYNEKRNKVKVSISVYEEWENISMRNISCGEKYIKKFERKVGVRKETKEEFESVVKGSIGIKGLGSLETNIRSKVCSSFCFDHWVVDSEEREIIAPKCGKRIVDIWQKTRLFYVEIIDTRIFSIHKSKTDLMFCQYLDLIYDKTKVYSYDPICDCGDKVMTPDDGVFELTLGDKLIILTAYKKLENGNTLLENLNHEVTSEQLGLMIRGDLKLDFEVIPKHLTFMSNIQDCNCKVFIKNHNASNQQFSNEFERLEIEYLAAKNYLENKYSNINNPISASEYNLALENRAQIYYNMPKLNLPYEREAYELIRKKYSEQKEE